MIFSFFVSFLLAETFCTVRTAHSCRSRSGESMRSNSESMFFMRTCTSWGCRCQRRCRRTRPRPCRCQCRCFPTLCVSASAARLATANMAYLCVSMSESPLMASGMRWSRTCTGTRVHPQQTVDVRHPDRYLRGNEVSSQLGMSGDVAEAESGITLADVIARLDE